MEEIISGRGKKEYGVLREMWRSLSKHQHKSTVHLVYQACILTQVSSNLHPLYPGHL